MAIVKKTQISIDINMDENNIPEEIKWTAPDGGILNMNTKAILLSFWDSENQESLKMDLWVKDMPVDQMQLFFHQTLRLSVFVYGQLDISCLNLPMHIPLQYSTSPLISKLFPHPME